MNRLPNPENGKEKYHKILPDHDVMDLVSNLRMLYEAQKDEWGKSKAMVWFGGELIRSVPGILWASAYWRFTMFRSYIKIAIRNILKHKGYSFINISGLSIGLSAVILILLFVQSEVLYDRFHANSKRIYRVMRSAVDSNRRAASMPAPLGPALEEGIPEVERASRFAIRDRVHISANDKNFFEDGWVFTDPSTFGIFSFYMISGDTPSHQSDPYSVLISESMADKYYGDENPVGSVLRYKNRFDFIITGIFEDVPDASSLHMNFVVPFITLEKMDSFYSMSNWRAFSYQTYLLLSPTAEANTVASKIIPLVEERVGEDLAGRFRISLQPLEDIHFSKRKFVIYLFTAIAGLILIIACINYINLTTARSAQRLKEIGVRKVVGAGQSQLFRQFLGESLFLTGISFCLALVIVQLCLPMFTSLVGRPLPLNLILYKQFGGWLLGVFIFVGLIAGVYPAVAITSRNVTPLIQRDQSSLQRSRLRNIMVVFQFMISIILILTTMVLKSQLHYVHSTDLGFRKNDIVVFDIRDGRLRSNITAVKQSLIQYPAIQNASASYYLPNMTDAATTIRLPGKSEDEELAFYINFVDYEYLDLFEIDLADGRNFSREFSSDKEGAFLLNEAAVRAAGWEDPLGKEFKHWIGGRSGRVVGVVKDYHMNDLHQPIEPLCLDLRPEGRIMRLSLRIDSDQFNATLPLVRETLAQFAPDYPFVFKKFSDILYDTYRVEEQLNVLFTSFSFLAIFIACLGLLGLAAFTAEKRTKEIGIRKVMGASVSWIVMLLTGQFTRWVIVANVIAWPISYWALSKALQMYTYRIDLELVYFLAAGGTALILAFFTVAFQAFKAAKANPVDSLRCE